MMNNNNKDTANKRRKVILKINGIKINQSRTSYSSRQKYLDMSQQKYKPFVVRLGTSDKFRGIQIPQEEDEQNYDALERYGRYFKIKRDMDRLSPKEFQKKYIWGGTRNPTQVKTEKARSAVISRRLRTNYDNYAYMHDVLDISTVSISGDPKLKELNMFCTQDLQQVLNTPLKQLPQLQGNTNYTVISLISQILADIKSAEENPQRFESDEQSISDSKEFSENDVSCLHEENENESDREVVMTEGKHVGKFLRVKDVTFDSEEWQTKLNKLKETL